MQTQYINEMLDIPELQILESLPMSAEEVHIKVTPIAQKQCCQTCRSDEFVILKGNNGDYLCVGPKKRYSNLFRERAVEQVLGSTVEGRHNWINAYQRRHYFMRNRENYKAGILVECNRNRLR